MAHFLQIQKSSPSFTLPGMQRGSTATPGFPQTITLSHPLKRGSKRLVNGSDQRANLECGTFASLTAQRQPTRMAHILQRMRDGFNENDRAALIQQAEGELASALQGANINVAQLSIHILYILGFADTFIHTENGILRARWADLQKVSRTTLLPLTPIMYLSHGRCPNQVESFVQRFDALIRSTAGFGLQPPGFQRPNRGDIDTIHTNKTRLLQVFAVCFSVQCRLMLTLRVPIDADYTLIQNLDQIDGGGEDY